MQVFQFFFIKTDSEKFQKNLWTEGNRSWIPNFSPKITILRIPQENWRKLFSKRLVEFLLLSKMFSPRLTLVEKCFRVFRSVFCRIWIEYGEILRTSPYSVRMQENTVQKNSEYGRLSRSVKDSVFTVKFTVAFCDGYRTRQWLP